MVSPSYERERESLDCNRVENRFNLNSAEIDRSWIHSSAFQSLRLLTHVQFYA